MTNFKCCIQKCKVIVVGSKLFIHVDLISSLNVPQNAPFQVTHEHMNSETLYIPLSSFAKLILSVNISVKKP